MASAAENKRLVRTYFEAIGAGDLDRVSAMMTPDLHFRCAGGTGARDSVVFRSPAELITDIRNSLGVLFDAKVGLTPEILSLTAEDDRVVAEVRIRGRSAKTGEPYDNLYAFFFWIREGRFAEIHEHLDTAYVGKTIFEPIGIGSGAEMPWLSPDR